MASEMVHEKKKGSTEIRKKKNWFRDDQSLGTDQKSLNQAQSYDA